MKNKTTQELQNELELMRIMYAQRRSLNNPRHQAMVGWSLVILALIVPIIAALMVIFF